MPVVPVKAVENDVDAAPAAQSPPASESTADSTSALPIAAPVPALAALAAPSVAAVEAAVQSTVNGVSTHAPISFTRSPSPPVQRSASPPVETAPTPTVNGDSTHTHSPISFTKGAITGAAGAVNSVAAIAAAVAEPPSVVSQPARSASPDVNTHTPISFSKATGKSQAPANDVTATDPVMPVPVALATAPVEDSSPVPVSTEAVSAPVEAAVIEPEVAAVSTPAVASPSVEAAAAAPLPTPAEAEDKALVTNGDASATAAETAPASVEPKTEAPTNGAPASVAAPGLPSPPSTPTRKSFGDSIRRSPLSAVRGSISRKSSTQQKQVPGEVSPSTSRFSVRSSPSVRQKRTSFLGEKHTPEASSDSVEGSPSSSKYGSVSGKKKPSFITKVKRVLSDKHISHLKDKE